MKIKVAYLPNENHIEVYDDNPIKDLQKLLIIAPPEVEDQDDGRFDPAEPEC